MSQKFNDYELELVAELTRRIDDDKPVDDLFDGDDGCRLCYMLHLAIEFDRLIALDSDIRVQITNNMLDDKMLIYEVMDRPDKKVIERK